MFTNLISITIKKSSFLNYLFIFFLLVMTTSVSFADPIWHCSRSRVVNSDTNTPLSFDLSESDTIEIAPIDLFQIFSGGSVFLGTKHLAACFMDRNHRLTIEAMNMLDIEASSLDALAKSDSIVQSKLHPVKTNEQMKSCIAKYHPAVGYLSEVIETEMVGPCF